jgi:hypothetical protein
VETTVEIEKDRYQDDSDDEGQRRRGHFPLTLRSGMVADMAGNKILAYAYLTARSLNSSARILKLIGDLFQEFIDFLQFHNFQRLQVLFKERCHTFIEQLIRLVLQSINLLGAARCGCFFQPLKVRGELDDFRRAPFHDFSESLHRAIRRGNFVKVEAIYRRIDVIDDRVVPRRKRQDVVAVNGSDEGSIQPVINRVDDLVVLMLYLPYFLPGLLDGHFSGNEGGQQFLRGKLNIPRLEGKIFKKLLILGN